MKRAWNELVVENPMLFEATRTGRRFFRGGGGGSSGVNGVSVALIGFFYFWLLLSIFRSREDVTEILLVFELVLLTLVVPASIYAAISGERERATWEGLILTRLTPAQIVVGKILWRLALILVIMAVVSLPIIVSANVSEFRNGPWVPFFLRSQVFMLTWGILLCAFGLWISAWTRRSVTSIAIIAATLLTVLILLPMLMSAFGVYVSLGSQTSSAPFGAGLIDYNPFYAVGQLTRAGWHVLTPAAYLVAAVGFMYATYRALRRLEEPRKR